MNYTKPVATKTEVSQIVPYSCKNTFNCQNTFNCSGTYTCKKTFKCKNW